MLPRFFSTRLLMLLWGLGFLPLAAGLLDVIPEWDFWLIGCQFVGWLLAPVLAMSGASPATATRKQRFAESVLPKQPEQSLSLVSKVDLAWNVAIAATALLLAALMGWASLSLPPAYHDEYSYLFQAETFRLGVFSTPSHPQLPALFDQMHVLNEGRMGSRYLPGTGLIILPGLLINWPILGHWCCTAAASVFAYWIGRELMNRLAGVIAGFGVALSPAMLVFENLLLAHQPTLLGVAILVWGALRWMRTTFPRDAILASCGLTFAMLCRPATAAGVGLPFGIVVAWRLLVFFRTGELRRMSAQFAAWAMPLFLGLLVVFFYNQSITGNGFTSTYQLYTDIYTPRHVYGFNNVTRGELKLGPKVIDVYDRWAENLTPELAVANGVTRLLGSWLWTWDVLVIFVIGCGAIAAWWAQVIDTRWGLIVAAILSLHAIHIPYWYAGIFGWHYVFESSWLWLLLMGGISSHLIATFQQLRLPQLAAWWWCQLGLAGAGALIPTPWGGEARLERAFSSVHFAQKRHAVFFEEIAASVQQPALILVKPTDEQLYMSYVVNSPELDAKILYAQDRRDLYDLELIHAEFPDRFIYACDPAGSSLELLAAPQTRNVWSAKP